MQVQTTHQTPVAVQLEGRTETLPDDLPPELLLMLLFRDREGVQSACAKLGIETSFDRLAELREQIAQAIQDAIEAEEEAGFWGDVSGLFGGDIASLAGLVATAALVAGSGGAGLPLALAAVGLAGAAKAGEALELDPKICFVLQAAACVAGALAGNAGAPAGILGDVHQGARLVQNGAVMIGGGAKVVEGQYRGDALEDRARADFGRAEERLEQQDLDDQIGVLERLAASGRFTADTVSRMQQQGHSANNALIARIGA